MISYNLPYFPIKNDKTQKNKQLNRYICKKLTKNKNNAESLNFRHRMINNNQIISNISKNNTKVEKIRQVIKINENSINDNTYHKEGENRNNNRNNYFTSQINNHRNNKLFDNCLKNEQDKKNSLIQKVGIDDNDKADFQSKDYIFGEFQNNDIPIKLNTNKK